MHTTRNCRQCAATCGFTLIEFAIGMFLMSVLLSAILTPLTAQIAQRKVNETQASLAQITEALMGFATAHGYLPCPDRTAGPGAIGALEYTAMLWAILWGWLFFGNLPTVATLAGAGTVGLVPKVRSVFMVNSPLGDATKDGPIVGDIDGAIDAMDAPLYGNNAAKAAIEIALHDLAGQASQQPVHALLGERKRKRIPLLGIIAAPFLLVGAGFAIATRVSRQRGRSITIAMHASRFASACGSSSTMRPLTQPVFGKHSTRPPGQ